MVKPNFSASFKPKNTITSWCHSKYNAIPNVCNANVIKWENLRNSSNSTIKIAHLKKYNLTNIFYEIGSQYVNAKLIKTIWFEV